MAKLGWGRILAGVATVAAAGAAYVYFRQRAARAPLHEVLHAEGAFEIRRYPALLVLETVQHGSRDRALGNGFGLLADYMFGEGREGGEIPIVMPMFAEPLAEGGWRIRFIVAEEYRDRLEPPARGIAIGEIPAREVAAVAVPAKATDRLLSARTSDLERWIEAQGRVRSGPAEQAYYTSPLKPGTARANEILIPLAEGR
jgi:hypothetical protein